MHKKFAFSLLALLLSASGALAAPLGSDLPGLLEYAREHNPGLAAARLEADAAAQRSLAADALPDPVLRTELMDFTNRGSNRPASLWPSQVGATRYLLMQSVPWFGRRDLQRAVAEAGQQRADGQVAATWAELAGRIKSAYAQYYYLSGSERLAGQTLELLGRLEQVAQMRYANGVGAQQDVIRAQTEQTGLRSELLELQNMAHHTHGRLNALLSRPNTAQLALPSMLRAMPQASRLDWATLEAALRARNPQLQIADAGVSEADRRRELAYNNRYPGFTLGIAPTQSGNQVKSWDLMVEFNIPLQQGARRAQEGEAEALYAAGNARKAALLDELLAALSESVEGLKTARRTETLVADSLLPQAELGYQSALAGYQTGKVDFATLLDAQRQIFNARRQQLKAQMDSQLRLAELESLIGEEL